VICTCIRWSFVDLVTNYSHRYSQKIFVEVDAVCLTQQAGCSVVLEMVY